MISQPMLGNFTYELTPAIRQRRKKEKGYVFDFRMLFLQSAQRLIAVHDRHFDVGKDQLGLEGRKEVKRVLAIAGRGDFMALILEVFDQDFSEELLIIDNECVGHSRSNQPCSFSSR